MKPIYEASNIIQAYIILNLLDQAGLSARIDTQRLQGGRGGRDALGLVRVMVEESGSDKAKTIVQDWGSRRPPKDTQNSRGIRQASFSSGLMGFFLGIAAMTLFYTNFMTYDGIGYKGISKPSERWTYVTDRLSNPDVSPDFASKTEFNDSIGHDG